MTHDQIIAVHDTINRARPETLISACNLLLQYRGREERVATLKDAYAGLYGHFLGFLDNNLYSEAALLIWGDQMFDPRTRATKLMWDAIDESNKILVIGGGSQGKTYSAAARIVLKWVEDPAYTGIKVISSTAGHAKNNIMAKILRLHRESALALPGKPAHGGLQFGTDRDASILPVAIPDGDQGQGRLTGFHPMPRPPHPKFGPQTRVAAYIDEADTVPWGVWEGLDNMLGSENALGSVEVVGLTNPRDKSNSFAARAEPVGGFSVIDPDSDEVWTSRDGWRVVRLDPAKSENVLQRKEVYHGMMTYEGYQNYVRKGKGNPEYWIMGRGWYPEQAAEFVVVPSYLFDSSVGVYTFIGEVTPCGSLDPAFAEGGDDPMMTTGRTGTATAFTPVNGPKIIFPSPIPNVVQMEQQFPIRKADDPSIMGGQVIEICSALNIRPEWFVMDRTGNALGLYGWLAGKFGSIMGIEWAGAATELKILQEDPKTAYERFYLINTEMYFAFGLWMQYNRIKFAPIFSTFQRVQQEISNRRYSFYRTLQKIEDKPTFKARNEGKSPDCGDSCVMLSHLIRVRSSQNPAMLSQGERVKEQGLVSMPESLTARPKFYETV